MAEQSYSVLVLVELDLVDSCMIHYLGCSYGSCVLLGLKRIDGSHYIGRIYHTCHAYHISQDTPHDSSVTRASPDAYPRTLHCTFEHTSHDIRL